MRYLAPAEYIYVKLRVAFIDADRVGIEYKLVAHQSYVNFNGNQSGDAKSYVTDFSMPHLNENNYYVEHIATMNGNELLNYALEWNDAMKHAQWVAFSFDKVTIGDVTGRTEAWDVDPKLPEEMRTSNDHHRNDGFDRGHICGSEDRVYSKLANAQTFYYSNMSPQLNAFNGGYWAAFEYRVRRWSRYSFPHLYVAKGGALNHLLVNFKSKTPDSNGNYATTDEDGRTIHGLACPKYYYMALLAEKQGNCQQRNATHSGNIAHLLGPFQITHGPCHNQKNADAQNKGRKLLHSFSGLHSADSRHAHGAEESSNEQNTNTLNFHITLLYTKCTRGDFRTE